MEIEENVKIRYIENMTNNDIKFKLSLINNSKINIKVSLNNIDYASKFESYNFNSFEFFEDLSTKQIYNNLKDNLSAKNIKIEKEENNLKVTIKIKTEFDYENFSFYVSKNNNIINKENKPINEDYTNLNPDNNEVIIDNGNNSENYLLQNKIENKENTILNNFNDLNRNIPDTNFNEYSEDEDMEEYTYYKNQRIKQLNDLQKKYSEKEKVEIIKKKYLNKKIFCFLCQEYTYINKFYKSTDETDYKILVKFYCSETHKYHSFSLIDLLFQCCQCELFEGNIESYRDGNEMALTNEELNLIKNKFKIIKEKVSKKNELIKDRITQTLPEIKNLTEFQTKLYQKFEKTFNNNSFYNELLLYFIQMSINTYEQAFNRYHSQAIICTLRNFTDYSEEVENDIQNFEIKNDITKDLLNGITYFKKNFIIKIYEPEIDLSKFKNKSNITISNDDIMCFRYLNKYKILLLGSLNGKIYCFNIEQNKCFLTIQAHKEEEENRGNWGLLYINEIEGNRLITCCEDSTMKLWEIFDKSNEKNKSKIDIKYITVIRGHRDMVRKVIFSLRR